MSDDRTAQRIAEVLVKLHAVYPTMRFGQLVCFVTDMARDGRDYGPYDVEDVDWLAAAERHLASRQDYAPAGTERRTA
jgi:hypothetical protein